MTTEATPREVGSHAGLGTLMAKWAEAEGVRFTHRSDGRRSVGTVHEEGLIDLMRAVQAAERERWATAARLAVEATPEQLPMALDALADVLRA